MSGTYASPLRRAVKLSAMLLIGALSGAGSGPAVASEDVRTCLARESADFFQKLATAVATGAIEPSKIDDAFVAQGITTMMEGCKGNPKSLNQTDEAAFRDYMARWPEHLDRRLSDITRAGASD